MFKLKVLLTSLLTALTVVLTLAQTTYYVHGTVTNTNNLPEENINILVTAFFADSTVVYESVYTGADGTYGVTLFASAPNIFGWLEVTMVDCQGVTVSQQFSIGNGIFDVQADFDYCAESNNDSCVVFILQEWNPGQTMQLTAWTPPNSGASFVWSTGETTETIFPQSSGMYCVTASMPFGCVVTDCIEVNLDTNFWCFAYIISTANNDSTYNLEAIASGVAPFTYAWTTGETTSTLQNVGPGTYCVVVTDSTGCAYTTCIIVDDFNFCEAYIYEEPNGGLTAAGFGLPPVYYVWNTGDSTQTIYPNAPGVYCVTITDANGCNASSCYQYGWGVDSCYVFVNAFISDSNTLGLQAIGSTGAQSWLFTWSTGETGEFIYPTDPALTYCVTMTDSDGCVSSGCFEPTNWCYAWVDLQYADTSTAVLTVYTDPIFNVPGSPIPSYLWSNGETTSTITVHESGEYCVTVTHEGICETQACVYVDFDKLNSECSAYVFQYQDTSGQWLAEAWAWGWGAFEYSWSNGDTNSVTIMNSPDEFLCVTVTTSFGCEAVACVDTFFQPCQPLISISYISNTSAELYAYAWNDPNQSATYLWSTGEAGQVITVSAPGIYCVTVTGGGCTGETCIDVYFWNVDSCGVWISSDGSSGAGIEYTANAWGTPPFTYLWSNGGTEQTNFVDFGIHDLCVTVTDANGCVSSGCNYQVDSCYVGIIYSNNPTPSLYVETWDPLALVYWSTGDSLPWIEITNPGTYCATVTTIFGCVTTACITIDTIVPGEGGNGGINGYVLSDSTSNPIGFVSVFAVDANNGQAFALVDSVQIGANGFYAFQNLPDGIYLLKAHLTPGTPGAENFIPTYHLNSTKWEEASAHILPNWLPVTTDIWMVRSTEMGGGGIIGGTVTDPQHILAEEGDEERGLTGLSNVVVLLRDQYGQPLDFAWSLEDGSFRFTDLPWGTYRISFDIAGITSPDIWVTLTPENPERLQITLVVEGGTVAVEEPVSEEIQLYPNPAKQEINIPVSGLNTTYDIRMVDMQGKIVYAGSARNINGVLTVGISSFAPGLYHVNLNGAEGYYHGRFIKQD